MCTFKNLENNFEKTSGNPDFTNSIHFKSSKKVHTLYSIQNLIEFSGYLDIFNHTPR